jgi:hypothetical protein
MADSERRNAFAIRVVLGLMAAALAQGCSSASPESVGGVAGNPRAGRLASANVPAWIICGMYPAIDAAGQKKNEPEYYVLSAMNRILRYAPEFAAGIGLTSVRTCDEARAFYGAYQRYSALHPYFDRDIPFEPISVPQRAFDPPPDEVQAAAVQKIFGGFPAGPSASSPLFPVVSISFVTKAPSNGNPLLFADNNPAHEACPANSTCAERCSGTFIARNWILTAAHCIAKIALLKGKDKAPDYLTDYDGVNGSPAGWQIDWPDANGLVSSSSTPGGVRTISGVRAWAMAHPKHVGVAVPQGVDFYDLVGQGHFDGINNMGWDVALLWIQPPTYDGHLASDASKSAWPLQFESMDRPNLMSGWSLLTMYGYGPVTDNNTERPQLRSAHPDSPVAPLTDSALVVNLSADVTNMTGFGALCEGDSGGPLTRTATVFDAAGNLVTRTIIIGVNQLAGRSNNEMTCGHLAGNHQQWSRVDAATPWILFSMQSTQNHGSAFTLRTMPDQNTNSPQSFAEYWGKPCRTDCDCLSNQYCENPTNDQSSVWARSKKPASCDDCVAAGSAGCGCMVGQCLPLPTTPIGIGGVQECSGVCTNTLNDIKNCGVCGTACPSPQSCVSGKCM